MSKNKIFLLIGKNIQTSLSPFLHNRLFQLKQLTNYHYKLHNDNSIIKLQDIKQDDNFGGMSITIPFKKQYQKYQNGNIGGIQIMYQGQYAKQSKVINTLIPIPLPYHNNNKINKYIGYNTDIYGIQMTLKNTKIQGNILLLGAGATSQTFCYYLQNIQKCTYIIMYNRSQQKILKLKQKYKKIVTYQQFINKINDKYNQCGINTVINSLPTQVIKQNIQVYQKILSDIIHKQQQSSTKFSNKTTQKQKYKQINFMDVNYRNNQKIIQQLIQKAYNKINLQVKNKIKIKINQYNGLDMLIWQAILQNYYFCKINQIKDNIQKQKDKEKQQNEKQQQYINKQNKQNNQKMAQFYQILKQQINNKIIINK